MRMITAPSKPRRRDVRATKLSPARLRRPTKLPVVVPTTTMGRYMHRLRWLFGGG